MKCYINKTRKEANKWKFGILISVMSEKFCSMVPSMASEMLFEIAYAALTLETKRKISKGRNNK
jgi:hypothetical protein